MKSPRQPPAGSPQLPHSYLRDHVAESESLRPGLMDGVTRFGANGFTLERARRRGQTQPLAELNGLIEAPIAKTYALVAKTIAAGLVRNFAAKTLSGTCTATIAIDGTAVTGIDTVSVTSTLTDFPGTALNVYTTAQRITLVIASPASPVDLEFTLSL